MSELRPSDVVVIGAGVVGAACAHYAARAGLSVTVLDRGPVAGGTTGAGEGNLLVSDKQPGPELELALLSLRLWAELADGEHDFEYQRKGGLIVARTDAEASAMAATAATQRARGIIAHAVDAADLPAYEPHLSPDLTGATHYPQDAQVQPALAAAALLRSGVRLHTGVTVTGFRRGRDDRVLGVRTSHGELAAGAVVNAAGTWSGAVAALAGVSLPILPRRGFVLVTEPLPPMVRHKVYAASYSGDVAGDDADLASSAVVEGTPAGTILIGASRERVGFDRSFPIPVLRRLAAQAIELFPFLAGVSVLRAYRGFRPYCPDHLPVIGPDPRVPGLWHACGHEGAGVGLAPATGHLVARGLTGKDPEFDPTPFAPTRFAEVSS
ncbi:NAD(P)/FAD-dependent oxidoreductase [Embleya scabrispora]|uniref:NAD(P)/FAD-dependent oxidoreductase n=1 Tax=Embleya scabrispora TaxID=159449 RepID=UPI00037BD4EE|nr:FAD-binding oxidoreductase [Embleya scabrispora]MYS82914.1 FAD-dependent oxidoreductase [Streptomyces sp. SID5474]